MQRAVNVAGQGRAADEKQKGGQGGKWTTGKMGRGWAAGPGVRTGLCTHHALLTSSVDVLRTPSSLHCTRLGFLHAFPVVPDHAASTRRTRHVLHSDLRDSLGCAALTRSSLGLHGTGCCSTASIQVVRLLPPSGGSTNSQICRFVWPSWPHLGWFVPLLLLLPPCFRFEGAEAAHSIIAGGPEPLTSQFSTSYSLVLNLLSVYSLEEARDFLR